MSDFVIGIGLGAAVAVVGFVRAVRRAPYGEEIPGVGFVSESRLEHDERMAREALYPHCSAVRDNVHFLPGHRP